MIMRTTLALDDDAFLIIREYASSRSMSLGKAASELVRRGLHTKPPTKKVNGLVVFDLPEDCPAVNSSDVRQLMDDDL